MSKQVSPYSKLFADLFPTLLSEEFSPYIQLSGEEKKILEVYWMSGFSFQVAGKALDMNRGVVKVKYDKIIFKIISGLTALPKYIADLKLIKEETTKLRKQNREFHNIFNALPTVEKEKIGDIDVRTIHFAEMPDISVRLLNVLNWLDIKTVGDLIRVFGDGKKMDLYKIRNFGRKCMTEIEEMEREYGFALDKL